MNEWLRLGAAEAARRIAAGTLKAETLVTACLERIHERDGAVRAWVQCDADAALAAARRIDRENLRGPLAGIPVGFKDVIDTAGMPTGCNSAIYRDHVPEKDCGVVARIREAGGIVIGKTNTPEFGLGANTRNSVYGATGNPFDPSKSAAGSSATAAGC